MGSFIAEIIGWILRSVIAEIIGWILNSLIDILIKIPGYGIAILVCRFRGRKIDREISPDGAMSVTCGLLFWALVGSIGYRFYN
jgi:hypothetical protein